jgi:hypothetical protein
VAPRAACREPASGRPPRTAAPRARQDRPWAYWERRTHAVVWRLLQKGLLSLDELRRAVEQLPEAEAKRSYYEKRAASHPPPFFRTDLFGIDTASPRGGCEGLRGGDRPGSSRAPAAAQPLAPPPSAPRAPSLLAPPGGRPPWWSSA